MTELKTLKEIEEIDNVGAVLPHDLRKEAIKWAKDLNREIVKILSNPEKFQWAEENPFHIEQTAHTVRWIIHFFNLTPEDLR